MKLVDRCHTINAKYCWASEASEKKSRDHFQRCNEFAQYYPSKDLEALLEKLRNGAGCMRPWGTDSEGSYPNIKRKSSEL